MAPEHPVVLLAAANSLVRVLLEPACASCGRLLARPLDGPVCAGCWAAVQRITPPCCVWCGDALATRSAGPACSRCRRHPRSFEIARSAGRYDGTLRDIIHAFKYGRRRALAAPLAALMRDAGAPLLEGADAVVPVPLHPWRHLRRGFNQADDLARALGLPVWRLLVRRRDGPSQASLPAGRRHANVRGAFGRRATVADRCRRVLTFDVPGDVRLRRSTVVLVDDVMTTGATLEACSRALARAGVRRVRALTVARAVAPRPAPQPPRPRPPGPPR